VFGIRDHMDERNDCTRAVRDKRFEYRRNYHAYKPWAQTLECREEMPTMQAWRKLAAAEAVHEKEPLEKLLKLATDADAAVRWWGATGLGLCGGKKAEEALTMALKDSAPVVRVAAADGLRRLGKTDAPAGVDRVAARCETVGAARGGFGDRRAGREGGPREGGPDEGPEGR
jgi:hypothetical protein